MFRNRVQIWILKCEQIWVNQEVHFEFQLLELELLWRLQPLRSGAWCCALAKHLEAKLVDQQNCKWQKEIYAFEFVLCLVCLCLPNMFHCENRGIKRKRKRDKQFNSYWIDKTKTMRKKKTTKKKKNLPVVVLLDQRCVLLFEQPFEQIRVHKRRWMQPGASINHWQETEMLFDLFRVISFSYIGIPDWEQHEWEKNRQTHQASQFIIWTQLSDVATSFEREHRNWFVCKKLSALFDLACLRLRRVEVFAKSALFLILARKLIFVQKKRLGLIGRVKIMFNVSVFF